MTILNENNSLLLIIDIQEKLLNAVYNKEILAKKAKIMANAANILNIPIIVSEQYPKGLGNTIEEIKSSINTEKTEFFEKTSFSALDNININNAITRYGKKQIIVFGIETHICVSQTTSALIEKGYDVTIITDASGSRKEREHIAGIDRMKEFGAHTITAEIALFEWLRGAKHPKFRDVQALIK